MKKAPFLFLIFLLNTSSGGALMITEVFSNPVGDDNGREWVEIYNETTESVDISALSISIKGGSPVFATPVSGGTILPPLGYAIIGSTVSGATKFLLDYPSYTSPLLKAPISLVNTGVTSIDIRLSGSVVDALPSYTAAKEGYSYARHGNLFSALAPTPGAENGTDTTDPPPSEATTTSPVGSQVTIPQMSPPGADILLFLPNEKVVVAGAPTLFSISSSNQSGKSISNMSYVWSFGDGGRGTGSTTVYRYFHPGRYVVVVDASNGLVAGKARMLVKAVAPDIFISSVVSDKNHSYIELTNPNSYELDISDWKVSIDGALFSIPHNTIILPGVTKMSAISLGFASTTTSSSTVVRLLFSNQEEVVRSREGSVATSSTSSPRSYQTPIGGTSASHGVLKKTVVKKVVTSVATTTKDSATSTTQKSNKRDTRIASFFRSLLQKE